MPVIIGIHLRFLSLKIATLEKVCVHAYGIRLEERTRDTEYSVASAKTLDHTPAGEKITCRKFIAKGDILHWVSALPLKSSLEKKWKNSVKKFRLARIAERFVNEPEKKCPTW